jgi:hypothetical protein
MPIVRHGRKRAGIAAVCLSALLTGCASGYDGVLWRQVDRQESVAYELIDRARTQMATQDQFVVFLGASPLFWGGPSQTVPLTAGESGTVVHDVDGPGSSTGNHLPSN